MTIPERCARLVTYGEPPETGPGDTLFTIQLNGSLRIEGAASTDTLRSAIESGFLDEVASLHVDAKATLTGFPEELSRLPLERVGIGSDQFTDWQSLYRLPVTTLVLESKVETLGEGIGQMSALRELSAHNAKKLTTLPGDFHEVQLTKVSYNKKQLAALRAHLERMPTLLRSVLPGSGVRLKDGVLTIGSTHGIYRDVWKDWRGHERALELTLSVTDEPITHIVLEPKSTMTALPAAAQLATATSVTVQSADFEDWSSVFRLNSVQHLLIEKKASGSLDGIAALEALETLWIKAKAIADLPAEVARMRSLKNITVTPALRPALEAMSAARVALALEAVLERFENALADTSPEYLKGLAPGVSDEELDAVEAELGIALPETVRALYRWRNGDAKENGQYVRLRIFSPLKSAAATWKMLCDMEAAGEWERNGKQQPGVWCRHWFPIARWSNGFHLCIDLEGTYGGNRGQVLEVWMKDDDRQIVAPDLPTWFDVFVRALEDGLIEETEGGDFDWKHAPSYASLRGYPVRKKTKHAP